MYKTFTKISFIIFSLLIAFLIQAPKTDAQLSIREDSTFGDNSKNFKLDLYDEINNVDKFIIEGNGKISNSAYYTAPGAASSLTFESYDIKTNQYFVFGTGLQGTSYGYDYKTNISNKNPIRIRKGNISLAENDFFRGADDEFILNLVYNGTKNIMIMKHDSKGKYGLKQGTNDLNFKPKLISKKLTADLEIIVPIYKKQKNLTTGIVDDVNVIIDGNSPNYMRPVLREAIATIQIVEAEYHDEVTKFIIFNPGLDTIKKLATQIGKTNNKEQPLDNKKKAPFGFGTYGFRLPERGDYKGISTETDIKSALVGIVNFILGFVASISVLILIYGGYLWMVDRGEDQLAEKSRKVIAGAVIGILLIISAWTIINTITTLSDAYPEGCEIGFDKGGGEVDMDIDCKIHSAQSLLGGGIQGALDVIF